MTKRKGFSLIEIIIALGVLAFGVVGVLSLFPVGMRSDRRSYAYTNASQLAEKWMAIYKIGGQGNGWYSYGTGAWHTDDDYPGFSFRCTFSDPPSAPDNTDLLTIDVRWDDRGNARSKSYSSYIISYN